MSSGKVGIVFCLLGILAVIAGVTTLIVTLVVFSKSDELNSFDGEFVPPSWGYRCESNKCKKVQLTAANIDTALSLPVCRLYCNEDLGTVWPKPTGRVQVSDEVVKIDPNNISFKTTSFKKEPAYWKMVEDRFLGMQQKKLPKKYSIKSGGRPLTITVVATNDEMAFTMETKEGYKFEWSENPIEGVHVLITADNFFGARNGLETLSQLIIYDNIRNEIVTVVSGEITDEPKFKYRGLHLDTSRNYYSVESIKRTIEGMGMVKLNTFHWHITDSHSFPLVLKSQPELAKLGAYDPEKVYTPEDIDDIVKFAKARGVRVLPEFDAPAHVGEGFQNKDVLTCFNAQPWEDYCVEPPCGQFDPSKDELYNILEDIYREMVENFKYPDIFHMGGDEVSEQCWNTSESLQNWMIAKGWNLTDSDFIRLWGHFQINALERLDRVNYQKVPIILWMSRLTEEPFLTEYLDKSRYIIQIWSKGDDPQVQYLLRNGYKVIVSNVEALYFDCGFGGWVTDGNNWCSPYIGWQKVYDNRMETIAGLYLDQVLGAESALWSEEVDDNALDSRLWPRASALAERLWSDPQASWRAAESRMLINRLRLVNIGGIKADRLQPEWCLQNEGDCPV